MSGSTGLHSLIAAAAPLFAGEAEVVRTYWDWEGRTVETDLRWLQLQCFKELKGSGVGELDNMGVIDGPLKEIGEALPKLDRGVDRHHVRHLMEELYEEFSHFCAFADAYDAIRPDGAPALDPQASDGWEEDRTLTEMRYSVLADHGAMGLRASKFSEGGYCTLFREGMRVGGKGGPFAVANDLISKACGLVYEDEFGHMLQGIVGLDDEGLAEDEWERLTELVVRLLRLRIPMRNGQFSYPLSQERIDAIYAGDIEPEPFDFEAAEERAARAA